MIPKQPLSGENEIENLSNKLTLKELELTSLLEITKSINSNLPESALYKIFHFTLLGNLNIPKLALFVLDNDWSCKVNYGTSRNFRTISSLDSQICKMQGIGLLDNDILEYSEFELVVPVKHKEIVLAYVLVGGVSVSDEYLNGSALSFIQTFANIIIVAIENKKLVRKQLQQEALKKEMEIARDVQSMLFPKSLPHNSNLKIHATYLPNLSIGGDYYDYIEINQSNFIVCVGDVSGKGISAALLMSNFQASLRTLVRQTIDLSQIIQELNHSIMSNAKGERFVTFFIAHINTELKTISYINAGHNPSFLINSYGQITMLEKGCTVLGAFPTVPFIEQEQLTFNGDTLLFCYTDGLTETNNDSLEEFGIDRIKEILQNNDRSELVNIHELLRNKLDKFKGDQSYADDITFLSCLFS